MLCSKCGKEIEDEATSCKYCGAEIKSPEWLSDRVEAEAKGAIFKKSDYTPFMLGVFIAGGLLVIPLIYGFFLVGLRYLEALPWSLASCVVELIAFRRNGTISWGRAIPAIVAITIGANVYVQSTGKPAFAAGGILGFLLLIACGYIGIGIGRLVRRKSEGGQP